MIALGLVPAGPASPAAALPNQEAARSSSPRSPLGTHASLPWVWLCLEGRSLPVGGPLPRPPLRAASPRWVLRSLMRLRAEFTQPRGFSASIPAVQPGPRPGVTSRTRRGGWMTVADPGTWTWKGRPSHSQASVPEALLPCHLHVTGWGGEGRGALAILLGDKT